MEEPVLSVLPDRQVGPLYLSLGDSIPDENAYLFATPQ